MQAASKFCEKANREVKKITGGVSEQFENFDGNPHGSGHGKMIAGATTKNVTICGLTTLMKEREQRRQEIGPLVSMPNTWFQNADYY